MRPGVDARPSAVLDDGVEERRSPFLWPAGVRRAGKGFLATDPTAGFMDEFVS
jgi:hypothetical protein